MHKDTHTHANMTHATWFFFKFFLNPQAYTIADCMEFPREKLKFDTSKSDGQYKKTVTNARLRALRPGLSLSLCISLCLSIRRLSRTSAYEPFGQVSLCLSPSRACALSLLSRYLCLTPPLSLSLALSHSISWISLSLPPLLSLSRSLARSVETTPIPHARTAYYLCIYLSILYIYICIYKDRARERY